MSGKHPAPAQAGEMPHVLREYALLADGERGILVGPRGDFVWMCFPGWDGGALFSSLIGGQGAFALAPRDRYVWGGYYESGSLIWRSRWITVHNAIIESREALALPASVDKAVVLRRVAAEQGPATVEVVFNPRGQYGGAPLRSLRRDENDVWRGRLGEFHLGLSGASAAREEPDGHGGRALKLEIRLDEGQHHDFVFTIACRADDVDPPEPDSAWAGTEAEWHARVPKLDEAIAPRDARHAYAVLSGLTSLGGGMVAAATTSLPERASEGRNFDYRYVWIRDQCYVGAAISKAGPLPLLDDAVRFVRERLLEHGPQLKPAYTTTGERVPDEQRLDLPGYPGGNDIVGNWVNEQFQLDGFGESLLLFAAAAGHDRLDADGWRAVETAADAIEARWREADAGIWELDPDEWTHSRLICVAGLRAISRHTPGDQLGGRWLALADTIAADAAARAVHRSGRWQRSPGDERIDASLLLAGIRGAVAADDPRTLKTLEAVVEELTEDGYAYRYRPDGRPLGQAEGAFLLCGFLVSLAYAQQGQGVAAARWFERNRAACGPPGLLSEEFDVTQRQLRGNLPQAFVHALLLECAIELAKTPDL